MDSPHGHRLELYSVKAIALRQQIKRNRERFPADFMFQLTAEEADLLLSQNVIPSRRSLGGFLPYVFTQEGVAMLSSVLNSERAVMVNIAIMRAFVKLRETMATHKDLAGKIEALVDPGNFQNHQKLLEAPASPPKRRIGFKTDEH